MALPVKVDEDLPAAIVQALRMAGYAAAGAADQGMSGWSDAELWMAVQSEGRFLVTGDKGFADIRSHPPGTHAGLLLLRPDEDGIRPLVELLAVVLASHSLDRLVGTIAVATPRGIRVRRMVVL